MIVRLNKKYGNYPDLTYGEYYVVIGIEADDFRLLNDLGRPYLYPHQLFEVANSQIPCDWITETGEDGEKYAYPSLLNREGFFEDFFDGEEKAITAFWRVVNQQLIIAAEAV